MLVWLTRVDVSTVTMLVFYGATYATLLIAGYIRLGVQGRRSDIPPIARWSNGIQSAALLVAATGAFSTATAPILIIGLVPVLAHIYYILVVDT